MLNKKILIVENEIDIVESVKYVFELGGIYCLAAYDGEEAIEMVKKEKPDLILLDIKLPKSNGYQVAKRLKSDDKHKNIPIIMLTARAQEADIKRGMALGVDEYVTKPFDSDMLVKLVMQHIR